MLMTTYQDGEKMCKASIAAVTKHGRLGPVQKLALVDLVEGLARVENIMDCAILAEVFDSDHLEVPRREASPGPRIASV